MACVALIHAEIPDDEKTGLVDLEGTARSSASGRDSDRMRGDRTRVGRGDSGTGFGRRPEEET